MSVTDSEVIQTVLEDGDSVLINIGDDKSKTWETIGNALERYGKCVTVIAGYDELPGSERLSILQDMDEGEQVIGTASPDNDLDRTEVVRFYHTKI